MRRGAIAMLLLLPLLGGAATQRKQSSHSPDAANRSAVRAGTADPGERVFEQNCSRCHQAPMSLAPKITGTVVMHMRVRARLSHQEEQELLRYLAP